ncbi:restriction endonuclease subunit S [Caloramator sp. mosi_1]|uniref:restriction endonuclease subunit S n=1 Tax=Caloramator sp. mosi_1 TaxID=3023090 RepID=UPI00235EA08D|nr:restriction endonuclease subunit S [Caloramator sp. mosi_1]WDC83728.1 restriction endonuclease subunit S [Caloramator sp. mosi_1]
MGFPIDLGYKKYIYNTNKKLSKIGFSKTRKLPSGSILVTCIGSTIGKIGIAGKELSTNQQINSLVCKNDIDNEYIYYSLSYYFRKYENFISTQAVPIINKSIFSEFELPIPPSRTTKIVDILSTVDEQIENVDKLIEKTKELKKA